MTCASKKVCKLRGDCKLNNVACVSNAECNNVRTYLMVSFSVPLHLGLQEVQRALDETRGNELPGFLNTSVYRVLVHKKIFLIEPHANSLLDCTYEAMRLGLKSLGDEIFEQYPMLYTELDVSVAYLT